MDITFKCDKCDQHLTIDESEAGIASRLPANSTWSESFKRGQTDPPRGFAFSALTLPDGKLIFVYAVHLKSNMAKSEADYQTSISKREDSAKQLIAHIDDMRRSYASVFHNESSCSD